MIGKKISKIEGKALTKKQILKKASIPIKKLDATKAIVKGSGKRTLVTPGKTGFFKEEFEQEATYLGGYSL